MAGTVYSGAKSNFAIVRYLSNCALDTAFSVDGKASIDLSAGDDEGFDLALQADGKILVTGKSNNPSFGDFGDFFALVRLNADGTLDPTFGNASAANTLDASPQFVAGGPAISESTAALNLTFLPTQPTLALADSPSSWAATCRFSMPTCPPWVIIKART